MRSISNALLLLIAIQSDAPPATAANAGSTAPATAVTASTGGEAPNSVPEEKKLKLGKHETAIYVTNMHCKTCAQKIARKLFTLKGVKVVRSDLKANLSIVVSQPKAPLDPLKAWAAVQTAGFVPTKLVGPAGTFVPHQDKNKKQPVQLVEKSAKKPAEAAVTR